MQPRPLWQRAATAVALVAGLAVAAGVGVLARDPVFAVAAAVVVSMAIWRPQWGAWLLLATASWDLVGATDAGRFTVRLSQVAALGMCGGALARELGRGTLRSALRGAHPALWIFAAFSAWAALRLALLGAPNPVKGYAYALWALFDVTCVAYGLTLVLRTPRDHDRALRALLLGFALTAAFGLLQWGVGLVTQVPLFITQWIGPVPRINALSYEPSYFAFCAVMGLSLALVAALGPPGLVRPVPAATIAGVLIVALAMASSRSGWIGGLVLTAVGVVGVVRAPRPWSPRTRRVVQILVGSYLVAVLMVGVVAPAAYARMLRKGLDLNEASSSAPRLEGVRQALQMFARSPLIGEGLGQFGGALRGDTLHAVSWRQVDAVVTFNLYAELLAETGLLGLGFVLAGLWLCGRGLWRTWRTRDGPVGSSAAGLLLAGALTFGVMFQFNQTLWRTEVWCLLGLALALERLGSEPPSQEVGR